MRTVALGTIAARAITLGAVVARAVPVGTVVARAITLGPIALRPITMRACRAHSIAVLRGWAAFTTASAAFTLRLITVLADIAERIEHRAARRGCGLTVTRDAVVADILVARLAITALAASAAVLVRTATATAAAACSRAAAAARIAGIAPGILFQFLRLAHRGGQACGFLEEVLRERLRE